MSRNSLTTFSYSLGHMGSYSLTTFQSNSLAIPILLPPPLTRGLDITCSSSRSVSLDFDFKSITGANTALAFLYCSLFGYEIIHINNHQNNENEKKLPTKKKKRQYSFVYIIDQIFEVRILFFLHIFLTCVVAAFFNCNCDCSNFIPDDQPATFSDARCLSKSSYNDIFFSL